jgi:SAM-dependent methyltransferase
MAITAEQAADIKRAWRGAAEYWTKHAPTIRAIFAPLTEKLIAAASLGPGQQVLDIAGGAGEPSLAIAGRIAPQGVVTCTDIAPEMLAGAAQRAVTAGLSNIKFQVCAADAIPFPDNSFDAVVCRFGAMFFPDTLAALREALRVLRPGGRAAFAVWGPTEHNPFFTVTRGIVAEYLPPPPEDEDAPGAFRYAATDKLAALWREAGASEVREETFDFHARAPLRAEDFWQFQCELSDTLRGKVAQLTPKQLADIQGEVTASIQPYFPRGAMEIPVRVLLVTARKTAVV